MRTPRDPQAHLERTHWTRLLLVYLPLEALLSPLHLAFCAAFLQPWVALKDVLYFVKELVKAVLLLCSWRIGLWEALCNVAKAFVALPSTGAQWGALLLVLVARVLAMYTRYRCSFGAMGRRPGVLFVLVLGHAAAGLLMSVAFLLRADKPGTGLRLPHHHSAALLAGVGSALADALLVFYRRGLQSSRGQGRFRLPPPPDGHRLLARGFDQGLFEVRHFTRDDDGGARRRRSNRRSSIEGGGAGGAGGLPVPRYARMLFPPLPDPPHDLPFFIKPTAPAWAKTLGRVVFKRAWLLLEASEALACLARAVATCVAVAGAVYPFEALLRALAALTWSPEWLTDALKEEGVVGTLTQLGVLYKVASTALSLSLAVYSGLALSTLLLYHILAQPVDFGNFASTTVRAERIGCLLACIPVCVDAGQHTHAS